MYYFITPADKVTWVNIRHLTFPHTATNTCWKQESHVEVSNNKSYWSWNICEIPWWEDTVQHVKRRVWTEARTSHSSDSQLPKRMSTQNNDPPVVSHRDRFRPCWFHLVSRVLPSRTSWISLASSVSYMSRASARFLCSLAWDFSRALARS